VPACPPRLALPPYLSETAREPVRFKALPARATQFYALVPVSASPGVSAPITRD
jgi:hypothetical protein